MGDIVVDAEDAHLPWIDHSIIQLAFEQPLYYFSRCPAFDRQSANAQLINQSMAHAAMEAQLNSMVGIQYRVMEPRSEDRRLCAIGTYERPSKDADLSLLKVYYMLDGMVYRSPPLGELFIRRIGACADALNEAADVLRESAVLPPGGRPSFSFSAALPEAQDDDGARRRAAAAAAAAEMDNVILCLYRGGSDG